MGQLPGKGAGGRKGGCLAPEPAGPPGAASPGPPPGAPEPQSRFCQRFPGLSAAQTCRRETDKTETKRPLRGGGKAMALASMSPGGGGVSPERTRAAREL